MDRGLFLRRGVVVLALLSSAAALAARRPAPIAGLHGPQGTLETFAAPKPKVQAAVASVFADFAEHGWGVRDAGDAVHASFSQGKSRMALHAYLSDRGDGKTGAEIVYENKVMSAKQRKLFERDILVNVRRRLGS